MRRGALLPFLFCSLLALTGVGFFAARWLHAERQRLLGLRYAVEQAAAPGEPVIVTDRWTGWLLERYGSAALKAQLRVAVDEAAVESVQSGTGEVVVVAAEGGPQLASLRRAGVLLTRIDSNAGRGIYFARRGPGVSSGQEGRSP